VHHAERYVKNNVHHERLGKLLESAKKIAERDLCFRPGVPPFRYQDEQAFRINKRGGSDCTQFLAVVLSVSGKRLTFEEATGVEYIAWNESDDRK